jgi:hypothetical protein
MVGVVLVCSLFSTVGWCDETAGEEIDNVSHALARHASPCTGPLPVGDEILQEEIHDDALAMDGVRLLLRIGDISPRDAAAVWWDLPAQAVELFPGSSFDFLAGDNRDYGFVFQTTAELPGVGVLTQVARYTAESRPGRAYAITVEAFLENALWYSGRGRYTFCRTSQHDTVLEITSLYDAKFPLEALNAAAVAAARAHQQRYLTGRRPTAEERATFRAAVKIGGHCDCARPGSWLD